jgi:hypothetical protein
MRAPAVPEDCVITLSADDVKVLQYFTGAKLPAIQDLIPGGIRGRP